MRFLFFFVFLTFFLSCKETVEPQDDESLYISEVFRYVYAPGQHATLALPADSSIFTGNPDDDTRFVYLGGFGGYIIAGFDHNIVNKTGADFEIYLMKSSTPEPAVVYVMQDKNGDGKPNETWYELNGSQFDNSKRNYWVRYYKATTTNENTTWLDSDGNRGELKSGFGAANSSGWWWQGTVADSITFYGTRLPDSYENTGTATTQLWTVPAGKYAWGYAENNSGTDYDSDKGSNKLDISNAVDENGNPVSLPNIRFLKIQTAVLQQAGWLNEVSSELRGAKELK
jgi:hypothetical protein